MQYTKLLFEKNENVLLDSKIKKNLKWKNRMFYYKISTKDFNGDHICEIIYVINYIKRIYKSKKTPIVIELGEIEFADKLVYIILETICYYLIKEQKQKFSISFFAKHTIWSEGISYSPLVNIKNEAEFINKFQKDLYMRHFRRLVPVLKENEKEYLSELMQDITKFLEYNGIAEESRDALAEVIIELVANGTEHGQSECLVDLDITRTTYTKKGDEGSTYYGLNVVVLNYSETLFYEMLKGKLEGMHEVKDRYTFIDEARKYHANCFDEDYTISDFYTISSFQHKISGSIRKKNTGGTGLTSLIYSLSEKADSHLCYMLSGNRVLFFEHDYMKYDEQKLIGFNKEGNYLTNIPDKSVFKSIKAYIPGTAYNLNFAIKKEWSL